MSNPKKIVVNCETGVTEEIELTDAEVAQLEADRQAVLKQQADLKAEQDAAEAAKASAQAKLKALGLSDDEVAALIG